MMTEDEQEHMLGKGHKTLLPRLCLGNLPGFALQIALTPKRQEAAKAQGPVHLDPLISFIIVNCFKNTSWILKEGADWDLYSECGPTRRWNDL